MIHKLLGLILAKLAFPFTSFLLIVLIARMEGKTVLGQYTTIWTWFIVFHCASLFGIGEFISKEVGANPDRAITYLTHGLIFVFFTSLICAVVMTVAGVLFKYPEEVRHGIIVASMALPFTGSIIICHAIFTAFQKIKPIALASILENFFFLLTGSAIIVNGYGIIALVWCLVIVRGLSSFFNLFLFRRHIAPLQFHIDKGFFKKLLVPVAFFGVTGVVSQIFLRIDVVMLSKMTDMSMVGLYSSASKLMEVCLILPLNFYALNLPIAARGYKNFRESVHRQIEVRTKQLFNLVFLMFGIGFFFSEKILGLTYGMPFVEAGWILKILMLVFLIMSAETVLSMSCQAAGYLKVAMYIAIIRLVANVLLNLILIPVCGALGAALTLLLSMSLSFSIYQYFVGKTLDIFHWIQLTSKPAMVCLLMMALLFPLTERVNLFLLGALFLLGYGLLLLAMNGFSLERVKSYLS